MRNEKAYLDPNWDISDSNLEDKENKVIEHTYYAIFLIALIGGLLTLLLVRNYGVNSFNLLYIAYVAQMALFPSVWSILNNNLKPNRRSAWAIALGLICGGFASILGLYGFTAFGTWAPVIALLVSCFVHWPFGKNNNI